jgi:MFS family permease
MSLGYFIGLGLDLLLTKSFRPTAPVPSAFSLLFAFTAFFFGVYGYRGITRGLVYQVLWTLIGGFFVTGIRAAMGLSAFGGFLFTEPAWVFGALTGAVAFLFGVGVMDDWVKWARGIDTPEHHEDEPGWGKYLGVSLDHKVIGIQYTVTALFLIGVGGLMALVFRTELAASGLQFLNVEMSLFGQNGPQLYNTLMSLHGMIMIVSILLGISGIINYAVPLLLGAHDMAFPRMNAFAYWVSVPASVLLLMSLVFGGFDTGWTGYPPLSAKSPVGQQMFFLGVFVAGWSSILGALNVVATVLAHARQGHDRPAAAHLRLGIGRHFDHSPDRHAADRSLVPVGDVPAPIWHGFLRSGQGRESRVVPAPLLVLLASCRVCVRAARPGHDLRTTAGLRPQAAVRLSLGRHVLAGDRAGWFPGLGAPHVRLGHERIPACAVHVQHPAGRGADRRKVLLVGGDDLAGQDHHPTPMLFVLGAIVVFLFGGLTGPPNATVSVDLHLHDTYFIVGHFHDTIFGGFVFPFFAAIYYWFPKATGRRMNEFWGKVHFWLMTPSFLFLTFGMMRVGLLGMRRRIADYDPALGFDFTHLLLTIFAFGIALSVLIFFINFFHSIKHGEKAEGNVWNSRSPEWQVPSPMPAHNYETPFEVVGEPYDYGLPGSKYVEFVPAQGGKH